MNDCIYITPRIYKMLCPDGQRLHRELLAVLEKHAQEEDIYLLLQRYFTHCNGIISKRNTAVEPCPQCSKWLVDDRS
jgi:hypothetical protein